LSICCRLTEMMDGRIGVESETARGSRFWFELPLEIAATQPTPPPQDLAGLTILVIDDLAEARDGLASPLRARGALVKEAGDMQEAAATLSSGPLPDLALIDLPNPHELIFGALTRRIGHGRILPTMHSGYGGAPQFCEENGFLAPLIKPIRGAVLARTVAAALGRTTSEAAETPEAGAAPARRMSPEEAQACGRLILVAEDNAVNRLVIAKQLTELGHCFEIAPDGEAAWDALRERRFGLLLSDCLMPVLDGYGLVRRIRTHEETSGDPRLPIVALTANVSQGEVEKCRASGFDDYLSKPVVLPQLAGCIEQWLPPLGATGTAPPGPAPGEPVSDAKDRQSLSLAAHTAKGAARAACAPLLADLLQGIEDRALTREPYARLGQRLDAAERAFADVRALIESGGY
jgi:CheY-like chemotaxis protein